MQSCLKFVVFSAALALAATLFCPLALGQAAENSPQNPETRAEDQPILPPRAAPTDYQAHGQAGNLTIAADFTGHSVPTPQAVFSSEDYVGVEVALFGAADAHAMVSVEHFSLRINGKKMPSPALPYATVFQSLKDPEWEPPDTGAKESKGKGGLSAGGNGQNDPPPLPPKMPIELKRRMQQRVQRASLREGDRALPEAGLLFFQYGGKPKGIRTIELIYDGPAGKLSLPLQP